MQRSSQRKNQQLLTNCDAIGVGKLVCRGDGSDADAEALGERLEGVTGFDDIRSKRWRGRDRLACWRFGDLGSHRLGRSGLERKGRVRRPTREGVGRHAGDDRAIRERRDKSGGEPKGKDNHVK
jgi:hypothetical protein